MQGYITKSTQQFIYPCTNQNQLLHRRVSELFGFLRPSKLLAMSWCNSLYGNTQQHISTNSNIKTVDNSLSLQQSNITPITRHISSSHITPSPDSATSISNSSLITQSSSSNYSNPLKRRYSDIITNENDNNQDKNNQDKNNQDNILRKKRKLNDINEIEKYKQENERLKTQIETINKKHSKQLEILNQKLEKIKEEAKQREKEVIENAVKQVENVWKKKLKTSQENGAKLHARLGIANQDLRDELDTIKKKMNRRDKSFKDKSFNNNSFNNNSSNRDKSRDRSRDKSRHRSSRHESSRYESSKHRSSKYKPGNGNRNGLNEFKRDSRLVMHDCSRSEIFDMFNQ